MKTKKIIAIILAVIIVVSICVIALLNTPKNKGPNILDFDNYTDEDLSTLVNEEVTIFGYFTLNNTQDNMAYISPLLFTAVSGNLSLADIDNSSTTKSQDYTSISLQTTKIMPIYFKETPEYTSAPIEVKGTLKKVDASDIVNNVKFNYAIIDATYNIVPAYNVDASIQEFYAYAKAGYLDVLYQNILNLEVFSLGYSDTFPEILNYEDVKNDFKNVSVENALVQEYLNILENVNSMYIKYGKEYEKNKSVDTNTMAKESEETMESLLTFVDKYGLFYVNFDTENNTYKLVRSTSKK